MIETPGPKTAGMLAYRAAAVAISLLVMASSSVVMPAVAAEFAPSAGIAAASPNTASAKKVVTRKVKTYFCDASNPVRTTTVTVVGRKVTAKAKGQTFAGTRKSGRTQVELWRKPSNGFPYAQFQVTFASATSTKAVRGQHLC